MIEQRFSHSAILRRIDDVHFLDADAAVLNDRGCARVRLRIGDRLLHTYAFRRVGTASCVVPESELAGLGVSVGQSVHFEIIVRRSSLENRIPRDLQAALEDAGVSFEVLHPRDQNQLLHMIRESSRPEIRAARIAAAIGTCKAAAEANQ